MEQISYILQSRNEVCDLQDTLKEIKSIIVYIIITVVSMSILGTVSAFIQGIILVILVLFMMLTFWFNPVMVIVMYFKIKKKIDDNNKQGYTKMEWTLIKVDIILAQFAGVVMTFLLALSLDKDFFMVSYGGFGLWSVIIGMGGMLILMFLGVALKDLCPALKTVVKNKKEVTVVTEGKKTVQVLLGLAAIICVLIVAGILSGKKLIEPPSLKKMVQDKAEYILKHKDYVETIRQYIEDLDYEEIVRSGEWKQKVGNLEVSYHINNDDYGTLCMDAEEVLKDIKLKDINIVECGEIKIEFNTKTYEIRKIRIPIRYTQTGIKNLTGGSLVWYSSDYPDKTSGLILDENWQMLDLEIAGKQSISPISSLY